MNIEQFGKGLLPDKKDYRDYKAEIVMGANSLPKEFSLRDKIEIIKTQGKSSSCVAQAVAYYAQVLNKLETDKFVELSARDIYSQIYLLGGGAYLRDGIKQPTKTGIVEEIDAISYKEGEAPSEGFMRNRSDITKEEQDRGMDYLAKGFVSVTNSFEKVKQAIYQGNGCLLGLRGYNEGWEQAIIRPGQENWGHAIYCCGFKEINGKEYIEFPNSWGKDWGDNGFGYFGKEFFDKGLVINPWTLIDMPNPYWTILKKEKNILEMLVYLYGKLIANIKKNLQKAG